MNEIVLRAFNDRLEKLAKEDFFKFKVNKKWAPRAGWAALGAGAGMMANEAYHDWRLGNSISKQQPT